MLLKEEEELMMKGDLEIPQIQEYLDEEENYLDGTMKIENLYKEFKPINSTSQNTDKITKAVNGFNLSVFQN